MNKRKLLWVGDAAVSSGFARCTHNVCDALYASGMYDIRVIGLNYQGDPHSYPYPILPCKNGWLGCYDDFGVRRMKIEVSTFNPDVVILLNDPWNIKPYIKQPMTAPAIGWLAVDGKNIQGAEMNGLACGVFWTEFGRQEATLGGFVGDTAVVPLGVDQTMYRPLKDRMACRTRLQMPTDAFIVGSVGRNQPRKRLDLTFAYFAEWIRTRQIEDAYLFVHVAPTGDSGWDLRQLASYLGIANKVLTSTPDIGYGSPEEALRVMYNALDVLWNTGTEGWWLPGMEAMACGVPTIVTDWSATGEWVEDAAIKIPCTSIAVNPEYRINTVAGVPDREASIRALDQLYQSKDLRYDYGQRGLKLVAQERFRWDHIAYELHNVITRTLSRKGVMGLPPVTFEENTEKIQA